MISISSLQGALDESGCLSALEAGSISFLEAWWLVGVDARLGLILIGRSHEAVNSNVPTVNENCSCCNILNCTLLFGSGV